MMQRLNKRIFLNSLVLGTLSVLMPWPLQAAATIDHNKIQLQSLNKLTARTSNFEVNIGETIKIGNLYIRAQACRTAPATERPESAGFIQVWTVKEETELKNRDDDGSEWVFSGWMFASSPGLSSMDHPVYDLWVTGCGVEDAVAAEQTIDQIKQESANSNNEQDAAPAVADDYIIEEDDEDAPVVIIDGETINIPSASEDARFKSYDEDESAPILYLE